ncbi:acyltransferase domain-containing protein [Amycolatopsis acidicola]|uniref:Acyltransferase domain-containing protein n=2 Tax=Amycolatopsis acidicola TaxID=2596893 RepID=A0A5N0VJL3_9PSEU|nr:acyltransferase domain-containing protein [Amycolatopsis acidicola]
MDERDWLHSKESLREWLTHEGPPEFGDAVDKWRSPGRPGPVRGALLASDREDALARLDVAKPVRGRERPVALLFPGQGAQHALMGTRLYQRDPVFTAAMDEVFELFGAEGTAIRDDWLSSRPRIDPDDLRRAQPLLFAVDRALGRMVCGWGVRPAALLGHSVGEVAAATMAGVFGVADAVTMMRDRIGRLTGQPAGGMLAVAADPDEVRPFLRDVVVGAVNARRQLMLAGLDGPLREAEAALRAAGYGCRRAKATTAFHSPVIAPALTGSKDALASLSLRAPGIPLYSGYTGGRLSPGTATDPAFWADQPAQPVLFGPALDALLADQDHLLVDAGPSESLAALARRHPKVRSGASAVTALLPAAPGDDRGAVLRAAAALWLEGHELDLTAIDR